MVVVAPHQYVNAKILRLQGRLADSPKHGETVGSTAAPAPAPAAPVAPPGPAADIPGS